MEDRERIAKEILEPRAEDGASLNLSWEMAVRVASRLVELGYTRQPEPPVDKMEAVRKILFDVAHHRIVSNDIAREILKLFPEKVGLVKLSDVEKKIWKSNYISPTNKQKVINGIRQLTPILESVELEALGDEEISDAYTSCWGKHFTEAHRAISKNTIQKN